MIFARSMRHAQLPPSIRFYPPIFRMKSNDIRGESRNSRTKRNPPLHAATWNPWSSLAQAVPPHSGECVEHRLQIEGRAADDLEHVGGSGLLLPRIRVRSSSARLQLARTVARSPSRSPPDRQKSLSGRSACQRRAAAAIRTKLRTPMGDPSRNSGTPSMVRNPPRSMASVQRIFQIGQHIGNVDRVRVRERYGRRSVPRPGAIGLSSDELPVLFEQ